MSFIASYCNKSKRNEQNPWIPVPDLVKTMAFFGEAINTLKVLVIALGAGLGVWGIVNLLEGYGNDNPGAKSQGMKQLMAGGGIVLLAMNLIPLLSELFN